MNDLEIAYKLVFDDIMTNGPDLFKGKYDAKNGKEEYMYGIGTVMEYLAYNADHTETEYEIYQKIFLDNIVESKNIKENK